MSDDLFDQLNRFVIIVAAIVVAFVALAIVVFAWGAPGGTIDHIASFAGYLRRHDDRETKIIISLGSAVVVLLMLTAIMVELTPPSNRRMRVRNVKSGDAVITTRQIAERINSAVGQAAEIADCRSMVTPRGNRVEVVLDLHVEPGADLSQTADGACRRAQSVVEQELGIGLASPPRARLHYRELRLGKEAAAASARSASGWERPLGPEEDRDERRQPDASEAP